MAQKVLCDITFNLSYYFPLVFRNIHQPWVLEGPGFLRAPTSARSPRGSILPPWHASSPGTEEVYHYENDDDQIWYDVTVDHPDEEALLN